MKVNDSGMPDEKYWESLFNIESIVSWVNPEVFDLPIIEIGGGYGTFTLPIAQKSNNTIISYDIEEAMIKRIELRCIEKNISNIMLKQRDVVDQGFEEKDESIGAVLLFNILHFDKRIKLLKEANRVISRNGKIFIIHWRKDIDTPRGPSLDIRPTPNDILYDIKDMGLCLCDEIRILEPYHWGIIIEKRS
ncbi:MAG: class I SAM-dependent methyltransferase [Candidatus Delongbacteria bacterium]|nr:class I SAM-dependent methyltransferase [Candidatus Delongbacteria bacterium]